MGTRDIVIALILTCVFILFADYLFNDNSGYCIIPSSYIKKVNDKDDVPLTNKEINDAITLHLSNYDFNLIDVFKSYITSVNCPNASVASEEATLP